MKNQEINTTMLAQERTLLASERTYSAWIRTALSAMAGGLAILRLITFKSEFHRIIAHVIGQTLIVWGCLLVVLASIDYKKTRHKLMLVKSYKNSTVGYIVIVVPLLLISFLLLWVTLP